MASGFKKLAQLVEDATKRTAPHDTFVEPSILDDIKSAVRHGYWIKVIEVSENNASVDATAESNTNAVDGTGAASLLATKRARSSTRSIRRIRVYVSELQMDEEEEGTDASEYADLTSSEHVNERAVLLAQLLAQRLQSQHAKTRLLCLHIIHTFLLRSLAFRVWWFQIGNLQTLVTATTGLTFHASAHSLPSAGRAWLQPKSVTSQREGGDNYEDDEEVQGLVALGNALSGSQTLVRTLYYRAATLFEVWVTEFILGGKPIAGQLAARIHAVAQSSATDDTTMAHSDGIIVDILQRSLKEQIMLASACGEPHVPESSYLSLVMIAASVLPRLYPSTRIYDRVVKEMQVRKTQKQAQRRQNKERLVTILNEWPAFEGGMREQVLDKGLSLFAILRRIASNVSSWCNLDPQVSETGLSVRNGPGEIESLRGIGSILGAAVDQTLDVETRIREQFPELFIPEGAAIESASARTEMDRQEVLDIEWEEEVQIHDRREEDSLVALEQTRAQQSPPPESAVPMSVQTSTLAPTTTAISVRDEDRQQGGESGLTRDMQQTEAASSSNASVLSDPASVSEALNALSRALHTTTEFTTSEARDAIDKLCRIRAQLEQQDLPRLIEITNMCEWFLEETKEEPSSPKTVMKRTEQRRRVFATSSAARKWHYICSELVLIPLDILGLSAARGTSSARAVSSISGAG